MKPVLIVGAGPVGLVTALRLAHFGIECTIIEAEPAAGHDVRASTFHPPTLDMLDEYGLAEPLIALGRKCPTWQVRMHETNERAQFDLGVLKEDTAHPYRLQCEQFHLCELLLQRLRGSSLVKIEWDTRVTSVAQTVDEVVVQAIQDNRAVQYTGALLVGADGARSVVRDGLGVEFAGTTYPETTILATTAFPFHEHLPDLSNVNYVWMQHGTFSLLRLPAIWRCSLYAESGETIEAATQPASIERKLQRIVARSEPYTVLQVRPYRIHKRVVSRYRVGRVVLAGDAAHINSPSGGMGMNGGIHDAFSLSERIRAIAQGSGLEELDRYERQRRPVAADEILAQADHNRSRMQERDIAKRRASLEELQRTAANPVRAREHLLRSSMIDGLRRAALQD
ncbi:MAG: FAD-dependent monooxygenase [Casimicrobiaceae bacterium]